MSEKTNEELKSKWLLFLNLHDSKTEKIKVGEEDIIKWTCSCGAQEILPANPAFLTAHRGILQSHFMDLINAGFLEEHEI